MFLRRRNNSTAPGAAYEYLFLPCDSVSMGWGDNPVTPSLPFNNSNNIHGSSLTDNPSTPAENVSPNLQFDLGIQQVQIKASGTLIAMSSSKIPQLNPASTERYIIPTAFPGSPPTTISTPASIPFQNTTSTTPVAYTGKELRNLLLSFVADQAYTPIGGSGPRYTSVVFGWYNWGAPDDVVPNGWIDNDQPTPAALTGTYRLFNGLVTALQVDEVAGVNDTFDYNFTFVVGSQN